MGARKMAETGSVRKKASGVGLGGIFNRKNSTEKKNAKAQAQAVVQAPGQGQAQGHPVVQGRSLLTLDCCHDCSLIHRG